MIGNSSQRRLKRDREREAASRLRGRCLDGTGYRQRQHGRSRADRWLNACTQDVILPARLWGNSDQKAGASKMDSAEEQEFLTRRLNQIKEQRSRAVDLIPIASGDNKRLALHRRVAALEQEQREAEVRLQNLVNEQQKSGRRFGPAGS